MANLWKMRTWVLWNMHPGFVIVSAALSLFLGIGSAVVIGGFNEHYRLHLQIYSALNNTGVTAWVMAPLVKSFNHPWLALLMGIAVGIPFGIVYKAVRGKNVDFFAVFHLMPVPQKLRWSNQKLNLLFTVNLLLPGFVAGRLAWLFAIALPPAFFAAWVPLILMYPEQKAIYAAMKRIV